MKLVESKEINDDLVYEIFPFLIFTRQQAIFNYMIKGLYSDEKNCEGANPETVEKIPCAYRIMEYLAPVIKDFPLEADVGGDIKMHVYPLALQQARDWFRKVGSDYSILQDTF